MYVSAEFVLSLGHVARKTSKNSGVLFLFPNAAAGPHSHEISTTTCIQQCSSSGTKAAVLQALAFVPVTVYVCDRGTAAGGDRTTTTPFSHPMQWNTHRRVSYQACETYSSSTKKQQPVFIIGKSVFLLLDLRRGRGVKLTHPKGEPCTEH